MKSSLYFKDIVLDISKFSIYWLSSALTQTPKLAGKSNAGSTAETRCPRL